MPLDRLSSLRRSKQRKHGQPAPSDADTVAWHAAETGAVLAHLDASREGLDADEAAARLARIGPNALPQAPRQGLLKRLALQLHNVLIYLLLAAAALAFLLKHAITLPRRARSRGNSASPRHRGR